MSRNGEEYWVYHLEKGGKPTTGEVDLPEDAIERADDPTLDSVYQALIDGLFLHEMHREHLRKRGLTDVQIDAREYCTLLPDSRHGLATLLAHQFGDEVCRTVPGLYQKKTNDGLSWEISGPWGIGIPVRNLSRQIVAIKIRRWQPEQGPKYVYMSSAQFGGPGPGAAVHVPLMLDKNGEPVGADDHPQVVRITEGELKADIATALTGVLTLSIPGVSVWRPVLPILASIRPELVLIAMDADASRKRHVAQALCNLTEALLKEEYT